MNIAVTGYNGSGSSALCAFLCDYYDVQIAGRTVYEHIPFTTPNGLLDLEYKLLYCNNMHRSDEAINSFLSEMKRINDCDFGWTGGYSVLFDDEFIDLCYSFISELKQYTCTGSWSYDLIGTRISIYKFFKDIARFCLRKPISNFGRVVVKRNDGVIDTTFVTEEQFFFSARKFVEGYFSLFKEREEDNIIFDHLLMPSDAWKVNKYFGNDFRLIVVDRDVRDLFLYSKYIRPQKGIISKYPMNVNDFADYWVKVRSLERNFSDNRVLRIYYEDLIYKTNETIKRLNDFLSLKEHNSARKETSFDIEKAKHNTRLYNTHDDWKDEILALENNLPEYCYPIP